MVSGSRVPGSRCLNERVRWVSAYPGADNLEVETGHPAFLCHGTSGGGGWQWYGKYKETVDSWRSLVLFYSTSKISICSLLTESTQFANSRSSPVQSSYSMSSAYQNTHPFTEEEFWCLKRFQRNIAERTGQDLTDIAPITHLMLFLRVRIYVRRRTTIDVYTSCLPQFRTHLEEVTDPAISYACGITENENNSKWARLYNEECAWVLSKSTNLEEWKSQIDNAIAQRLGASSLITRQLQDIVKDIKEKLDMKRTWAQVTYGASQMRIR